LAFGGKALLGDGLFVGDINQDVGVDEKISHGDAATAVDGFA
jgi:hypothetical protein